MSWYLCVHADRQTDRQTEDRHTYIFFMIRLCIAVYAVQLSIYKSECVCVCVC